jgi:hypothetical protein
LTLPEAGAKAAADATRAERMASFILMYSRNIYECICHQNRRSVERRQLEVNSTETFAKRYRSVLTLNQRRKDKRDGRKKERRREKKHILILIG